MPTFKSAALVLGCALGAFTAAAPAQSQSHVFKDWSVACDNIAHCEAAGAQAEDADSEPVSLWIARDAGPGTPLKAKLMVQPADDAPVGKLTLKIGKFVLRNLDEDAEFTPAQAAGIVAHALEATSAEVSDGSSTWTLSFAGLKAALLKIDDVQGRIGTPGALVRKGSKAEATVPAAKPVPVVRAAPAPKGVAPSEKLLDAILVEIRKGQDECFEDVPDEDEPETGIALLSPTQVLVTRECWRAAYQSGLGAWVANLKPPYRPKRLDFPEGGTRGDTVSNGEFDGGTMHGYGKGRGLFDCGAFWTWEWTGTGFELVEASVAQLCRGMPGGGFALRTWTADVAR